MASVTYTHLDVYKRQGQDRVYDDSDMLIQGPKIVKIGKNLTDPHDQEIDATDKFVYPGLINTHQMCIRDRKKVGKLDRYFKEDATAAITFSIEKDRNQVEVTIRSSGTIFRVSESSSDMRASIDAAPALSLIHISRTVTSTISTGRRSLLSATVPRVTLMP